MSGGRRHARGQKRSDAGGPFYLGAMKRQGKKRHPDKRRREIASLKRGKT